MSAPILVATDLSPRCDRAVDRAAQLAAALDRPLLALHVAPQELGADARAIERLRRTLTDQLAGRPAELLIAAPPVPQTIARIAAERGCALIVTGVARFNSPADYLLGTAVDTLVRASGAPVLVVKQRVRGDYRRILAATDFSEHARTALEAAAALFPEAALRAVHIVHAAYEAWLDRDATRDHRRGEAEEDMAAFRSELAPELRARLETRVDVGELGTAMLIAAEEYGADLIALATHGRSGLAHAALGSRASELLETLPIDTLVVKARRRSPPVP